MLPAADGSATLHARAWLAGKLLASPPGLAAAATQRGSPTAHAPGRSGGPPRYRARRGRVGTCDPVVGARRGCARRCSPSSPAPPAAGRRCTTRLATGIAGDPALAGLLLHAPPGQRQPVLLFACVHDLLLGDGDDRLAGFYPNLTAPSRRPAIRCRRSGPSAAPTTTSWSSCWPPAARRPTRSGAARCCCRRSASRRRGRPARPPRRRRQRRAQPAARPVPLPVRARWAMSAVRRLSTSCAGRRARPDARRRCRSSSSGVGLDRAPIDVGDPVPARWLEACVWPDQTDRFDRLRAAVARGGDGGPRHHGRRRRPRHGSARDGRRAPIRSSPTRGSSTTCRRTSAAPTSTPSTRCGRRARPVVGVRREPGARAGAAGPPTSRSSTTSLVLVRWRDGRRTVRHLAQCHPHGYWLHWT